MRYKIPKQILCMMLSVLLAAAVSGLSGCTSDGTTPEQSDVIANVPTLQVHETAVPSLSPQTASEISEALAKVVEFTLEVTGADGITESRIISTDRQTVGEALLSYGLIDGEDGPYGLYIKTVLGETHDYDTDGYYWAFYIDGEYAMTGADSTQIVPESVYALRAEH